MLEGALRGFARRRLARSAIDIAEVPGAFELPFAASLMARSGKYAAIVCLGCVVRGETPHFEYVCAAAAHGISAVARDTGVPVIFGVLTTDTQEQAWARATRVWARPPQHIGATGSGNKGYEAALAAVDMALFQRRV